MAEINEITTLLDTFQKAHEHGPGLENIKETALRRLKVLNDEAGKKLADEKKAEAEKLQVGEQKARAEAEKEVHAKVAEEDKVEKDTELKAKEEETKARIERETAAKVAAGPTSEPAQPNPNPQRRI